VDIIQGIRTVQEGQAFFTPASLTGPGGSDKDSDPTKGISSLTNREMQVYELIGEGLGTSAIAKRLNLSVKTIESHKENIKNKLQVHSASELLRHAMQWAMGI
jgi:DNA-binding NarL/FixJ family response regulator